MSDTAGRPPAGPATSRCTPRGLHKRFREGGARRARAAAASTCTCARGETLAIVGASGSGKSTLLHLLGGLEAPTQARVR